MATLDQRILNLIKNYMGKLIQKKVLTSMEEVEANTNETNLVAAPVVAELNNNLKGFTPILDTTGKITGYRTNVGGADTVFPFSSAKKITMDLILSCTNNHSFGDVKKVTCTLLINPDNSVSAQNTIINYSAAGSDGRTVNAGASVSNFSVSFV